MVEYGPRKVNPITPRLALEQKLESVPDFVIDVFNKLIVKNLDIHGCSKVLQDEVISGVVATREFQSLQYTRDDILSRNWLDIEHIFRQAGWDVVYDKPGYSESYGAFYNFSKRLN